MALHRAIGAFCAVSGTAAVSLHKSEPAAPYMNPAIYNPRLHIITVTGTPMIERAVTMQGAIERWMSERDSYSTICDQGCAEASHFRLKQVVEMPTTVWPNGECRRHGRLCTGHEMSGVKFLWGLVHMVNGSMSSGDPMPEWFLLKDDDTYVDTESLMESVANYSTSDLISLASFDHPEFKIGGQSSPMSGGGGWLLSRAAAKALVSNEGQHWLDWQISQLQTGDHELSVAYDDTAHHVVLQVPGMKLYNHPAMSWVPCHCHDGTRTHATCHLKNWLDAYDMQTAIDIADCGKGPFAVTALCANC